MIRIPASKGSEIEKMSERPTGTWEGWERRRRIGVDFDGVLHDWNGIWLGPSARHMRGPLPGAILGLSALNQDFEVFIHTTRGATWRGRLAVRKWLRHHGSYLWEDQFDWAGNIASYGLKRIRVTDKKLPAIAYIDDRAIAFDTKPPAITPERIRDFQPWWRR